MSDRPLNAESLRNIAAWLDTYDRMAVDYFKLLDAIDPEADDVYAEIRASARAACEGDEVQRDLRRWADEMDSRWYERQPGESNDDRRARVLATTRVHKATPASDTADNTHCIHCGQWIKRVVGGNGPTWIHKDTGAVAASGAPR